MSLCSKPQNDFGDYSTSAGPSNSYLQYSSMKWFWRGSSLPVKWFWKLWTYPCEMIFLGLKVNDFEELEVPKWNMRPKWVWNIRGLYFEWSKKKWFWEMIFWYLLPQKIISQGRGDWKNIFSQTQAFLHFLTWGLRTQLQIHGHFLSMWQFRRQWIISGMDLSRSRYICMSASYCFEGNTISICTTWRNMINYQWNVNFDLVNLKWFQSAGVLQWTSVISHTEVHSPSTARLPRRGSGWPCRSLAKLGRAG